MGRGPESQDRQWSEWFEQERIVHILETIQNLIVVLLAIGLFFEPLPRF